jgi:hypothetical protein
VRLEVAADLAAGSFEWAVLTEHPGSLKQSFYGGRSPRYQRPPWQGYHTIPVSVKDGTGNRDFSVLAHGGPVMPLNGVSVAKNFSRGKIDSGSEM